MITVNGVVFNSKPECCGQCAFFSPPPEADKGNRGTCEKFKILKYTHNGLSARCKKLFAKPNEKPTTEKRCPRCDYVKPLTEYYKSGYYHSPYCKDCTKELRKEKYKPTKPDGIYIDKKTGRKIQKQGSRQSIYWDGNMLYQLKTHYPNTTNNELAELLGVDEKTMRGKAKELGLKKDKKWLIALQVERRRISMTIQKKRILKESN